MRFSHLILIFLASHPSLLPPPSAPAPSFLSPCPSPSSLRARLPTQRQPPLPPLSAPASPTSPSAPATPASVASSSLIWRRWRARRRRLTDLEVAASMASSSSTRDDRHGFLKLNPMERGWCGGHGADVVGSGDDDWHSEAVRQWWPQQCLPLLVKQDNGHTSFVAW